MVTVLCESSSPNIPCCPPVIHCFPFDQKPATLETHRHISTMEDSPPTDTVLSEDSPPTATDTVLSESILPELILRRQRRLASSTIQRSLLLEAAEVLADDTINYEDYFPPHGGSKPGKKPNLPRKFESSYNQLYNHYFSDTPLYDENLFRRRFRMRRPVFLTIARAVEEFDSYFTQKPDALGKMGIHPLVKITAALRMLAYGGAGDCNDEYLQLSETSSLKSMDRFCNAIVAIYQSEYLREPTTEDLERLLEIGSKRGFPGMLGSVDCMHWTWKNCPSAWAGQFQGKEKVHFF
jgi:hypothetical protein